MQNLKIDQLKAPFKKTKHMTTQNTLKAFLYLPILLVVELYEVI